MHKRILGYTESGLRAKRSLYLGKVTFTTRRCVTFHKSIALITAIYILICLPTANGYAIQSQWHKYSTLVANIGNNVSSEGGTPERNLKYQTECRSIAGTENPGYNNEAFDGDNRETSNDAEINSNKEQNVMNLIDKDRDTIINANDCRDMITKRVSNVEFDKSIEDFIDSDGISDDNIDARKSGAVRDFRAHNETSTISELSYSTPKNEQDDKDAHETIPFKLNGPEDKVNNMLSKRIFVKKLFKRVPQICDTTSILVRSKAHVKGKVGSRQDLAMGNSNKIKNVDTVEEPVYDGKPLYAGVYNGLTPCKHTQKRIIREIKVKVDWYAHSITHQIKNVTTFYEQLLRYIHPFQYQMLMTSIYELHHTKQIKMEFKELMEQLKQHKVNIINRANNFNSKIGHVRKCREAFVMAKAFILQLDEFYKEAETYIDLYRMFAKHFRKLPVLDIKKPIVTIIGCPNVGKSTLFLDICKAPIQKINQIELKEDLPETIGLISDVLGLKWQENVEPTVQRCQGEVKVADYKFSTKSVAVGEVHYRLENLTGEGQILDVPPLLWRNTPKINPYERLTYAALKDLPSGVIFCFDTSQKLNEQIQLYHSLESRFPHRPWINVITKGHDSDILTKEDITIVPREDLIHHLYQMFSNLDSLLKAQQVDTQMK